MDRDRGSHRSPLAALPRPCIPSGGEATELELETVLGTTALTAKPRRCREKPPPLPPNQHLDLVNYGLEEGM